MTQLLMAAPIRKKILKELKTECKILKEQSIIPQLKVVLVGNDPASIVYTENKKRDCEKVGANCEIIKLSENITEHDFLKIIKTINLDNHVHGCIIQLPLPKHLSHIDVGPLISKDKDVDGFHPENLYSLLKGKLTHHDFVSCTPKGIITLLKENNIELAKKNVVVIGRSMIVGKPLSLLFLNENASVTICHSHTKNIKEISQKADIIVCAIGKANYLDDSFLGPNKNQIIIDVGINLDADGNQCGDVNFSRVHDKVSHITPVPGGVGPMTRISLVQNLLQAAKKELSI